MKKLLFLTCLILSGVMAFAQQSKKVAILEVIDLEGKLSYSDKLMLRSNLARAVTNIDGYEAYTRTDMDAVLKEHDFQRSGNVRDEDIKKIGEMTGAAYILQVEGSLTRENNIYVVAQIINVETLQIEVTENNTISTKSDAEMLRGCRALASSMFGVLAGASTSTNKFLNLFKGKQKSQAEQRADSIAAAKKAEQAAAVAAAKEQQRLEAERIREERAASEKKAREERAATEKKAREERIAAEENARQERIMAEENARQERIMAEEKARQEREAAVAAALASKRLAEERKAAEEAERAKYSITKISKDEYRLGNTTMDRKAYEQFIYQNCPEAWRKHLGAQSTIITGWTFLGVGAVLCSAWAMLPLANYYYDGKDATYYITSATRDDWHTTGVIAGSIGAALAGISIPLLSAGYGIKYNTYKTYNKSCASANKSSLSLNLQAGADGLGLAMKF